MPRAIDSILSSMRSRKQETSSPRAFLPAFRKVGVAGWKRPVMISSTSFIAKFFIPTCQVRAPPCILDLRNVPGSVYRRKVFQSIGSVIFERPQESGETEFVGVGSLKQVFNELELVLFHDFLFVIPLLYQVFQFFLPGRGRTPYSGLRAAGSIGEPPPCLPRTEFSRFCHTGSVPHLTHDSPVPGRARFLLRCQLDFLPKLTQSFTAYLDILGGSQKLILVHKRDI